MAKARKLPSGNYRVRVFSHKDADGKAHYESFTAATKKEAEYAAAEFAAKKDIVNRPSSMTLRDAITKYIADGKNVLSPTTIHGYDIILRCAFQDILDMPIRKITPEIMRTAVNAESKRPHLRSKTGKTISAKTVINEYGLLMSVLHVYAPGIDYNVTLPQKCKNLNELSTPDVIFGLVKGTEIELAVLLAMWLSFTLSEIGGLYKSKSISQDGNYITITQVQVRVGTEQVIKSTAKQLQRHRTHRIPPYIKELIAKVDGDKLVPLKNSVVSKRFINMIDRAGLPHMTFHDLRHVSASVMKVLNVPDKYAQERGGWSSDSIMKGTYMQTFSQSRIAVDDAIDNYFEHSLFGSSGDTHGISMLSGILKHSPEDIYASLKHACGDNTNTILEKICHEICHEYEKT